MSLDFHPHPRNVMANTYPPSYRWVDLPLRRDRACQRDGQGDRDILRLITGVTRTASIPRGSLRAAFRGRGAITLADRARAAGGTPPGPEMPTGPFTAGCFATRPPPSGRCPQSGPFGADPGLGEVGSGGASTVEAVFSGHGRWSPEVTWSGSADGRGQRDEQGEGCPEGRQDGHDPPQTLPADVPVRRPPAPGRNRSPPSAGRERRRPTRTPDGAIVAAVRRPRDACDDTDADRVIWMHELSMHGTSSANRWPAARRVGAPPG